MQHVSIVHMGTRKHASQILPHKKVAQIQLILFNSQHVLLVITACTTRVNMHARRGFKTIQAALSGGICLTLKVFTCFIHVKGGS